MQDHYQLNNKEYLQLLNKGVTVKDLFDSVKVFSPYNNLVKINTHSLYFFVDSFGDFIESQKTPIHKIAKFLWERLDIKEKIAIAEYIEKET